ncbi:MAG: hypothetical protein AAGA31_16830, partial [Bacteroidota bacterium]
RFSLDIGVDNYLDYYEELVSSTDGQLRLSDVDVFYKPAKANFPFAEIKLSKRADDVGFDLKSKALPTGFSFEMLGTIDNLAPLLIEQPTGQLRTDVTLLAPHINWTDFLAFFGQNGYLQIEENLMASDSLEDPGISAMKKALVGIEETFHPTIEASFDSVGYYDVFTLTNFSTGLHYAEDTLVLERTSFDWSGSDLAFGARLHLGQDRETPFSVSAKADYLNLNQLLPTLNHFGLKLPAELDSLPDDLKIRFQHTGRIRDASGIMPGHNIGELFFDDGKNQLIAGRMNYQPGPQGLSTHLHLYGDPRSVSLLFGAEKFFFEDGNFNLNLHLEGTPETLRELMATSELRLTIDSSRVHYQPADVYVPLRQFTVDFKEERSDYFLHLRDDTTGRHLQLCGVLEDLSAFLYPEPGQPFRMQTDVSAGTLYWSDFERFLQAAPADTSSFSVRKALSTTGGVFNSFRPELSLEIDTFWAGTTTPFTDITAGLYVRNEDTLVLEKSGFHFGAGKLAVDATYLLDDNAHSPFTLNWQTDTLSLGGLQTELAVLGLALPPSMGALSGTLSTQGTVSGLLDEERHLPVMDHLQGELHFRLTETELKDWPSLDAIGRKALMKRRFQSLRLLPLEMALTLDTSRISFSRTEIQSTALQLFVEGHYDLTTGPDLLVSIPLRNIGRGVLAVPPDTTGYAHAGWKVYLASGKDKAGKHKLKFRLGKRRYYRERGRLAEFQALKAKWRAERKARRMAKQ